MNTVEIEQAITDLAEQPFYRAEFPHAFLEAFGNKATTIKCLRAGASKNSDLGGVLQTSNIHIRTCDAGVTQTLAAHDHNDEVLERTYIGRRFKNDTERLEKLFDPYTRMIATVALAKDKKRKAGANV